MKTLKLIGCCAAMLLMLAGSANAVTLEISVTKVNPNDPDCTAAFIGGQFEAGSPEFREALAYAILAAQSLTDTCGVRYRVSVSPVFPEK